MGASTFAEYALSPDLTPDEIYTVELLIERVHKNRDQADWDAFLKRCNARCDPSYTPHFCRDHVEHAASELIETSWVNLQRLGDNERPVRDVQALQFLPNICTLILTNSEVSDIYPLGSCKMLRNIGLYGNPLNNLSTLQLLPQLRELSISADQIPALKQLDHLPTLRKLEIGYDHAKPCTTDSFVGFPQMPELRIVWGAHVRSLQGLEMFGRLENIVKFSGELSSLEPLRHLSQITHINLIDTQVDSLEPLSGMLMLREFFISTDVPKLDLAPLKGLPMLHEIEVVCRKKVPRALARLKASLPSWDVEFRSPAARYTPSLQLEIVNQETFDYYDTKQKFNITYVEYNEELVSSELSWLDRQIKEIIPGHYKEDEDYLIATIWGGARSRTIVLLSEQAVNDFPRLVLGIQKVLAHARMDWIIYFQSDTLEVDTEFIVWIYPNKIMVTHEYAETVRQLISNGQK